MPKFGCFSNSRTIRSVRYPLELMMIRLAFGDVDRAYARQLLVDLGADLLCRVGRMLPDVAHPALGVAPVRGYDARKSRLGRLGVLVGR